MLPPSLARTRTLGGLKQTQPCVHGFFAATLQLLKVRYVDDAASLRQERLAPFTAREGTAGSRPRREAVIEPSRSRSRVRSRVRSPPPQLRV